MRKTLVTFLYMLLVLCPAVSRAESKPFVVVIDAGHGGKDEGASGQKKLKEKDINLAVALKLGKKINSLKGTRVHYTRKTDVFVPLDDRAKFANEKKADLFISIHTNSAENKNATGTEVYSFSPSSSNVAMRENAVMELEENYKKKYDGFNPRSSESYIQWDLFASDFGMSGQSKKFASYVSEELKKQTPLGNRGIKQAGFWVLKYSNMPGVLVEVGYVSNLEEEKFLRKDSSREKLAQAIYDAFLKYFNEYKKKDEASAKQKTQQDAKTNKGVHYRVQFYTGQQKDINAREFKNCVPATEFRLNSNPNLYTYMYGYETTIEEARALLAKVRLQFPDAFLVVFKDGERLGPNDSQPYLK